MGITKKNHKILILIGVVLVAVALLGLAFQADKTNKTLAYNNQQQEIKRAQDKLLMETKEEKYTQVVKTIKETDWSKAKETDWQNARNVLKEISEYKDESNISMYLDSLKYYSAGDFDVAFRMTREILKTYDSGSVMGEVENINTKSKTELLKQIQEQRDKGYAFSADLMLAKLGLESLPTIKPQPKIGMTANEVLNSRWGKPDKVNRTTTSYGVSEQWVYSSVGYVYLKDGIVDAIQD
ncbi:hypothetical protein JCM17380_16970 [Desulfosporosinus burensis]